MDNQKDDLKQAINRVLVDAIPGVEVRFDPYPGFGKLHATVVWDGYQGKLQLERQRHLWSLLRPALTEEQRLATGFLVTVTPHEIHAMMEVAAHSM